MAHDRFLYFPKEEQMNEWIKYQQMFALQLRTTYLRFYFCREFREYQHSLFEVAKD